MSNLAGYLLSWPPNIQYVAAVLVLGFLARWMGDRKSNPRRLPYPPGPRGYPLIGSLLDVPTEKPWLVYNKWGKSYGDIIFYSALGTNFLVLNSLKRTDDLLNDRSNNYSDRVRMPMLVELMNWRFNLGLMRYGPNWRRHRKMFHDQFNANVVVKYDDVQLGEVRKFLDRLLEEPKEFTHHIHHVFGAIIMGAVYGIKIDDSKDDPYVATIEGAMEGLAAAGVPGSFLVDYLPILKHVPGWFPGASFQKLASRGRQVVYDLTVTPFNEVKEAMKAGSAGSSATASMINNLPDDSSRDELEVVAQNVAAVAYVSGADSTASAVQAFFLLMALHPEVQKRAQAELDSVVGSRLPDFSDAPALSYLRAVLKEVLRWHQVVPFSVAHMSTEDDEYDGYFIPKGTIILPNAWSILNDPTIFEEPSKFNPDRYFKNPNLRGPDAAAFGYGRRICPGRFFADRNFYAMASSVLTVFNILPPVDEVGQPTKLEYEPTSGFISYPSPFSCRILPRSQAAKQLVFDAQA
ncbi:putative CyP450 monooxygenase [Panaeolus papilionaceus]|nr:putative CyP450 monooxygenase [Panaeolus papilionaceus]